MEPETDQSFSVSSLNLTNEKSFVVYLLVYLSRSGVRGPVGPRPAVPPDVRFPGPRDHTGPPMDLPPVVPPFPGDAYSQATPNAIQNSAGRQSGSGQDLHTRQEPPPQDSARPALIKP